MGIRDGRGVLRDQPELVFSSSPVFDFFATIYAVLKTAEGYTFDFPEGWLVAARRAVGAEALRELRYYFGQNPSALDLMALATRSDRAERVEGFLQYLESTPPAEVAKVVLAGRMPESFHPLLDDLLERYEGVRGDDPKLQYVLRWFLRVEEREKAKVFLRFPAESKRRVLQLLQDLYVRLYRAEEEKLVPFLAVDVERKRLAAETGDPAEVVERYTGERLDAEQRLQRVVLAPSLYIRPFTLGVSYGGTRTIIYPLPMSPNVAAPFDAPAPAGPLAAPAVTALPVSPPPLFDLKPASAAPSAAPPAPVSAPAVRRGRPGRPPKTERKRGRPKAGAREAASLVAVHKALGDDTRLRMLRLLAERERYTQELAEALGLTHPTVLHHLDLMLKAGLVVVHDTERLRYYRVNETALEALSARVIEYLAQGRGP
ncbi:MAG: ArsR/SmtB family transcription factor [Bacillota bacterium]